MTTKDTAPAGLCRPVIEDAGLPQRTPLLLERERNLYPFMVARLGGGRGSKGEDAPPAPFPLATLQAVLAARDGTTLPAAAWLAGRCAPDAPAGAAALTAALRDVVGARPVDRLGDLEWAYVEAAFSLALRGDRDAAHAALTPLIAPDASRGYGYLAAFYLAQLGDPAGYPALLAALRSPTAHTRLMALRHLIAFAPYDGQRVGAGVVDLRAALLARLRDHDPYVRVEAPYYLAEAGAPDLAALLEPVAAADPDEAVRAAAQSALDSAR
jgi:hypothetical protein